MPIIWNMNPRLRLQFIYRHIANTVIMTSNLATLHW